MTFYRTDLETPIGRLGLVASDTALVAVDFERVPEAAPAPSHPMLELARTQLAEYFAGRRRSFELPLAPAGSDWQKAVWQALVAIPFAKTVSYGELARGLGRPSAARAVGAANGKNPIAIVVPCHRVIGADGSLTGYAGGVDRKRWLLDHESRSFVTSSDTPRRTHRTQSCTWSDRESEGRRLSPMV
jgi:methylated-DNA-[protein]-cysteine S-methyltransferase